MMARKKTKPAMTATACARINDEDNDDNADNGGGKDCERIDGDGAEHMALQATNDNDGGSSEGRKMNNENENEN